MAGMNKHDHEVLRVAAGEDVPGFAWGAVAAVSLEFLKGSGLVKQTGDYYKATDKGRELLAELEGKG